NTKNAIQYVLIDPVMYQYQYRNLTKQENYGVEFETTYKVDAWRFALNYTFTDGKTKSPYDGTGSPLGKDTTYYNLYRIPKHAVNLNISWGVKRFSFGTNLRVVSSREEFIYGLAPETLDAYATVDVYSEYSFNKKAKVFVDLKNVTNTKYFDIPGYN